MRFMVIVKANEQTEAGVIDEAMMREMGRFNEELVKAGVMLAGEGLHPSSKGARVHFSGAKRTVTEGPFAQTGELVAGYWVWKCDSLQEAIDWARRCPNPTGAQGQLEIRRIYEAEDLGEPFTPELREQEDRLRAQIASRS